MRLVVVLKSFNTDYLLVFTCPVDPFTRPEGIVNKRIVTAFAKLMFVALFNVR